MKPKTAPNSSESRPQEPDAREHDSAPTEHDGAARLIAGAIGRKLKSTYGELLKDPIPQKFLDLLDELEAKTSRGISGTSGKDEGGE